MSENTNQDSRSKDRKEIDDWMYGGGGKVLVAIVVGIFLWFVVSRFL